MTMVAWTFSSSIGKGPILTALDHLVNEADPETIRGFVESLQAIAEGGGSLGGFARQLGFLDEGQMAHLERDWFGEVGYWAELQPVEPVLVASLIQAGHLVLDDPESGKPRSQKLPLDCYWVRAGSDFEVSIMPNERQVTLLLLTPTAPARFADSGGEQPALDNIWLVRRKGIVIERR